MKIRTGALIFATAFLLGPSNGNALQIEQIDWKGRKALLVVAQGDTAAANRPIVMPDIGPQPAEPVPAPGVQLAQGVGTQVPQARPAPLPAKRPGPAEPAPAQSALDKPQPPDLSCIGSKLEYYGRCGQIQRQQTISIPSAFQSALSFARSFASDVRL
jgi:hypothetical protein